MFKELDTKPTELAKRIRVYPKGQTTGLEVSSVKMLADGVLLNYPNGHIVFIKTLCEEELPVDKLTKLERAWRAIHSVVGILDADEITDLCQKLNEKV